MRASFWFALVATVVFTLINLIDKHRRPIFFAFLYASVDGAGYLWIGLLCLGRDIALNLHKQDDPARWVAIQVAGVAREFIRGWKQRNLVIRTQLEAVQL